MKKICINFKYDSGLFLWLNNKYLPINNATEKRACLVIDLLEGENFIKFSNQFFLSSDFWILCVFKFIFNGLFFTHSFNKFNASEIVLTINAEKKSKICIIINNCSSNANKSRVQAQDIHLSNNTDFLINRWFLINVIAKITICIIINTLLLALIIINLLNSISFIQGGLIFVIMISLFTILLVVSCNNTYKDKCKLLSQTKQQ